VNPKTAFRWSAGTFTDLGLIDGFSTVAVDVNEAGDVSISTGVLFPGFYARIWTDSKLVNVGPIPSGLSSDAGRLGNGGTLLTGGIVQQSPLVTQAFAYNFHESRFDELPRLPDATGGGGRAIADNGTIIGDCSYPGGSPRRACLWVNFKPFDVTTLIDAGPGFLAKEGRGITHNDVLLSNGDTTTQSSVSFVLQPVWPVPGDTNCDELVDVEDLIRVILDWGACEGCLGDVTANGVVDVDDFIEVILNWAP
jgi:uncharacterized membrane protein